MMNKRPLIINVLMAIGLFLGAMFVFNLLISLISGLLWFALKIIIPVAIIVFIVRAIANPRNKYRNHY